MPKDNLKIYKSFDQTLKKIILTTDGCVEKSGIYQMFSTLLFYVALIAFVILDASCLCLTHSVLATLSLKFLYLVYSCLRLAFIICLAFEYYIFKNAYLSVFKLTILYLASLSFIMEHYLKKKLMSLPFGVIFVL